MVLGVLLYSSHLQADPVVKINLRLKAQIVESPCVVASQSQNMRVNLGTWATKNMKELGDRTRAMPFSIHLLDCNTNSVKVSFAGPKDSTNSNYLALDASSGAKNVAIEILDKNRDLLSMGDYAPVENLKNMKTAKIDFFANYIATRANVTAGKANSSATFVLTFD
ncbi:hypothetical protein BFG52_11905 [Acinetobacter larvae]|uniref:Fimbrial-type adhesion domain-containing protein n=2 Tax=Acinetobacter larvae TaxID=1789224 RepID=A0A1B2M450_9GAMM|nr:hypothetical protein BFG52_11905 [Acinetobacter larvae]